MKKLLSCLLFISALFGNAEVDVWGHAGISWQMNFAESNKSYAGLHTSVGFDTSWENGIAFGIGGYAAYSIYNQGYPKEAKANDAYKNYAILSDLYFSYYHKAVQFVAGRYDTNALKYEWFSGHNEGFSVAVNIADFSRLWFLYSFEQTLQFEKNYREVSGRMNALWDYRRHASNIDSKHDEHLIAFGADFFFAKYFKISPYAYFVTNNFGASGLKASAAFGDEKKFYSISSFQYTFLDSLKGADLLGHLLWLDQEFGYDWFYFGAGYYKTFNNGVARLTQYGDSARFYGSVIAPSNFSAGGEYFGARQSTYYAFLGARHKYFKMDILYAGGDYSEISALASATIFEHLEIGGGWVDLKNISNDKRNFVVAFIKAIW